MNQSDPQELSFPLDLLSISSKSTHSSQAEQHLIKPKTHVKFRGDAIELKHKVKLRLDSGQHRLIFEDIADALNELSFIVLEGAHHVVNSVIHLSNDQETKTTAQSTRSESAIQNQIEAELKDIFRAIKKAEKGVQQALRLFKEWITKARKEQVLELKEWRDGIALLEQTLLDRLQHQHELQSVHQKLKLRLAEHLKMTKPQLQTIQVELEVEQEDHYLFELSYVLSSATWHPVYQARLSEDQFEPSGTKPKVEAKLNLEMSARFLQATHESWLDCSAEFCLYPAPKLGFPTLNYPAYDQLDIQSYKGGSQRFELKRGLHSPWAGLCHLFSDQVTLNLNLELDLSQSQPEVMVVGQGKLDTLLPLGGGIIHSFVGDEWIGESRLEPLILGEQINLSFGLYAPLEVFIERTHIDAENDLLVDPDKKTATSEISEVIPSTDSQDSDKTSSTSSELAYERLNIAIKNTDPQVRTVLLSQPLEHGQLLSMDEGRPQSSAPIGWVLSADRKRLMRWLSIAPQRTERLSLVRKCF